MYVDVEQLWCLETRTPVSYNKVESRISKLTSFVNNIWLINRSIQIDMWRSTGCSIT